MEKLVHITSLDCECLIVKIPNPNRYNLEYVKDEVEFQTSIIGPHQSYYQNGKEIQSLESLIITPESPLELIENNSVPVTRFLINFRSRLYPVYISNFEKKFMLCLKLAIEKKFNSLGIDAPFDSQSLKLNGLEVPTSLSLSQIPYNAKIDLDLNSFIPQRPTITIYDLNDISEEEEKNEKNTLVNKGNKFEVKADERAAKWRQIFRGLSLQCYCRNRECEARNRMVVVNLGFGVFKLEGLRNKTLCPLCKELCQEILYAGFYFAVWKYKGLKSNEEVADAEERTWNQYCVWREFLEDWTSLKFSVRPNYN